MTNHKTLAGLMLATLLVGSAHAQTYTAQAELELDATGDAFRIGQQNFRVAPSAMPTPVDETTDRNAALVVAGFEIKLPPTAAKRSFGKAAAATTVAGGGPLAAAIDDSGAAVLVTQRLNVYADDLGSVAGLAARTGGEVAYSSALAGKAIIKYPSAQAALQALKQIQGQAGIKEASPQIIQYEISSR